MSSMVCFIDGQGAASCIQDDSIMDCEDCPFNPFPNRKVPMDRVLRHDD
jgi:hypothetical protein